MRPLTLALSPEGGEGMARASSFGFMFLAIVRREAFLPSSYA